MEVNLYDSQNLSGNDQFFIWNKSDKIKYLTQNHKKENKNLYVDEDILNVRSENKNYGLLLEPRCIKPMLYSFLEKNIQIISRYYDHIITNDDILIKSSQVFTLLPFTGGSFSLPQRTLIHKKNKLISSVISNKKSSEGHRLRHEIAEKIKGVDYFGPNYINLYTYPKAEKNDLEKYYNYVTGNLHKAWDDYKFCIVVENQKQDYFFSEKIISCFATGTIPIYWGANKIADYFDCGGILQFSNLQELAYIVDEIMNNQDVLYNKMLPNVVNNYNKHFEYKSYDDWVFNILNKKTY